MHIFDCDSIYVNILMILFSFFEICTVLWKQSLSIFECPLGQYVKTQIKLRAEICAAFDP